MAKGKAFVVGVVLGGAAAAAAAIWNSPQSGEQTRGQITGKVEDVIFNALGVADSQLGRRWTPQQPSPSLAASDTQPS